MRKQYIILPIILSLFSLLYAGAPDTLWTRTYGGSDDDHGYYVQQTSDGGFIIAGYTKSFGVSGYDYDFYLIRTNSNGDTLWTKTYGGANNDYGYSAQQTSDGGFIVTGNTRSFGAGNEDVYLVRTDPNGDTIWTKTYGGYHNDNGYSVKQTNDGGFIIAGFTKSFGAGEEDVYLIRTNPNGDTLWTKTYGGDVWDYGWSVLQTNDDGFIITGYTMSFGVGDWDVYLIHTNANGDTLWTKSYGRSNGDQSYSVQQTNDGGFIMTGIANMSVSSKLRDFYLIRTDSNGDTLWTKTYGDSLNEGGRSVQQTSDGGFIATGYTDYGAGLRDVYILRTDSNGDTLWTKTYGEAFIDGGYSVYQTNDGGFIIAGYTYSFGAGGSDVYLIRLDKDSTGIQQETPPNSIKPNNFIISNNHGSISIRYTLPFSTSVKLEAFDIKGKLVKVITDKFMNKGSYSVNWDSKRFGSGVYYIKLSTGNNTLVRKAVLFK